MGTKSWKVRTPLVIQMEAVECGAASLGIILGYYKKFVSLGELRYRCSITRDGSSMLNIVQAAEYYGLEASGVRTTFFKLEEYGKPAIILWNSSHYVVLEGFKGKKVYINDPEYGPISYPREEFHTHYSGIAIFLEPAADFKKSEVKVGIWQRLKKRGHERFSAYLFLLLSGLLLLLPSLAVPITLRIFIDHLYQSNVFSWKLECLLFLALAVGLGLLLISFHSYILKKISHKLATESSSKVLRTLLAFPLSFYQQRDPSEMVKRIQIVGEMSRSFTEEFIPTLIQLALSLFYAVIMFSYSPVIASVTLLGAFICLVIQEAVSRRRFALYDTLERDLKLSEACSLDRLHNIDVIKAAGSETFFFRKWIKQYTLFLNTNQDMGKKEMFLSLFPFFIQFFCVALLIGVGTLEVFLGHRSLGMLASLLILLILFLAPLKNFTLLSEKINQMRRNVGKIDDLTHTSLDSFFHRRKKSPPPFGSLEFKEVGFSYYPSTPLFLKKISFSLEPKQRLGVTGPVGSGKSIIGKLAAALCHPTEGEVLYGGNRANAIDIEQFRTSVGWVGQETFFFSGSYRDNITFWNHKVSDKTLDEVEEIVGLKSRGWIAERGKNLSRGEKQQLEMMRILLKKPSLLIMDNAMSALEPSLQERILDALSSYGCASLFISHDPILLGKCDATLRLEKGEIVW